MPVSRAGKLELVVPRAIAGVRPARVLSRTCASTGSPVQTCAEEIAYDYLSEIRIGRPPDERIDGRTSLMLAPRTGDKSRSQASRSPA